MSYRTALGPLALASLIAAPSAHAMALHTTTGGEIGLQLSDYRYEEDLNGSFFMSLEGSKLGVVGSYTQALDRGAYLSVEARYANGSNHYASASTGQASAKPDEYSEARLTAGRDVDFGAQLLSFYTGLGTRYLRSDLRGTTSTGQSGYRRSSHYLYLPLGLIHRFKLDSEARWSTTLEYDHLIQGTQTSYLTDVTGYTSDLENQQRTGHGMRLNLAYETSQWSASIFYHTWDIADSKLGTFTSPGVIYTGYEPHNVTREVGLQLRYRFR